MHEPVVHVILFRRHAVTLCGSVRQTWPGLGTSADPTQRRAHIADGPPRRNARTLQWLPPAGVLAPPRFSRRRVRRARETNDQRGTQTPEREGMMPRSGDVLRVTRAASVQFTQPMMFRVIRVQDSACDGWAWLDGYELDSAGEAVARRSIFVRLHGL